MATPTPGSFIDSGRNLSDGIEEIAGGLGYPRGQGQRGASPLVFPQDIGSAGGYNNHFMVIDILKHPSYIGIFKKGDSSETQVPIWYGRGPYRAILQAEQSIVLYMPNTLQFTSQNDYEEVSLSGMLVDGVIGNGFGLRKPIETLGKVGGDVLNPKTEILFSNTKLRQFQFDFLFAPSSQKESDTLKKILWFMRMAAAPTQQLLDDVSLLWKVPKKLQIRFYQVINGVTQENPALPLLKPLVIESLDLDYSPDGPYSTFSNGHPVSTRMMMRLREDEVIDSEWIKQEDLNRSFDFGARPTGFGGPT